MQIFYVQPLTTKLYQSDFELFYFCYLTVQLQQQHNRNYINLAHFFFVLGYI